MIIADVGANTPLELMLYDGDGTRAVRVWIRQTNGALVTTVDLTHVGEGLYTGLWVPPALGYYHANYIVYLDGTYTTKYLGHCQKTEIYRAQTPSDPGAIAAAVWEELLVDHNTTNTFGWAINQILGYDPSSIAYEVWEQFLVDHLVPGTTGWVLTEILNNTDPANITTNVWDILVDDHRIPDTFGDYIHAIHQYCNAIDDELNDPVWGLDQIYGLVNDRTTIINDNVLINTAKIDALTPLITSVEGNIISEVEVNRNLLNAMAIQNNLDKAEIIAEIDENEVKIDEAITLIQSLQNNTTARFVVPEKLVKPTTGTKTYQFHLRIYDVTGNPKAPDSTPTIRIRRLDTGVDIVVDDPMTQDGTKIGAYYYNHTISSGTAEYPALVEVTVVEDAVSRYIPSVTEITEYQTDLAAIQAAIAEVNAIVTTNQGHLESSVYGLAALHNDHGDILNEIANQNITLTQIKSKTDLIPNNIATRTDIDDILSVVTVLPVEADIQAIIDFQTQQIRGPDNRNLTQIYDLWDTSDLLKTNDPRLDHLDEDISSRSTLTAQQVWEYGTRTLTEYHLDPTDIDAIWAYLASQATVSGSIGNIIANYIDAPISSRASIVEVQAALAGVAQEATLIDTRTQILNELALCCAKLDALSTTMLQIKAKTDLIPTDPAREGTLISQTNTIITDLSDVALDVTQIRLKTDLIPPDPARETTVLQIPTNPVLETDARLAYLDTYISTRSTLTVADLNHLATEDDILYTQGVIVGEVQINRNEILANRTILQEVWDDTNRIPADPSTITRLVAAETAILDAIAALSTGDLTAEEVWTYATRTLTEAFPDISNLATKADVAAIDRPNYRNRMTTTFNPQTDIQEVLVWSELDGQRKTGTEDCTIIVKDAQGAVKWTASSSVSSADGIFRFTNPIVLSSDANYYIIMSIRVDGEIRVSQQAFLTVG